MHRTSRKLLALVTAMTLVTSFALPSSGFALAKQLGVAAQTDYTGRPDAYEPRDDSPATAPRLPEVSVHNFDTEDDVDWSIISAETTGQPFVLETVLLDGTELDTEIHVFEKVGDEFMYPSTENVVDDPNDHDSVGFYQGTDGYDYNDDSNLWGDTYASTVYFRAPHPGTFYVHTRMNSIDEMGGYVMYSTKGIARRIAGADRFDTAALVSHTMWSNTHIPSYGVGYGPDYCVVANGLDFADALAGSGLALEEGTSMLLTRHDSLPPQTASEIERLSESMYWEEYDFTVYVLGGPEAVSNTVVNQIKALGHVSKVVRLGGPDRYGTAVKIAEETSATIEGYGDTAFVVSGVNFADALAAGPVAYNAGAPILLTGKLGVPAATLNYLKTHFTGGDIYIVGGTGAIGLSAEAAVKAAVGPDATVTRVAGSNRYQTALKLAELGVDEFGMWGGSMTMVSGQSFPDGLSAAALSYWTGAPLLLTPADKLAAEVVAFEKAYGPTEIPSYLVGGNVAVGSAAYEAYKKLWSAESEQSIKF